MMWWSSTGWGAGSWTMMAVMMVVFWGAVITLTVWAIRRRRFEVRGGAPAVPNGRADRELAERFARGEIDEAQFIRARSVLSSTPSTPSSDHSHQGS